MLENVLKSFDYLGSCEISLYLAWENNYSSPPPRLRFEPDGCYLILVAVDSFISSITNRNVSTGMIYLFITGGRCLAVSIADRYFFNSIAESTIPLFLTVISLSRIIKLFLYFICDCGGIAFDLI